ncbi:FAD-dependent monooxygenase [Actinospica sp. MGRD01-02]|uniref:FAD-dependent monooxygenase n=1 Tax=Actinospica acidithermotolerans TaxID=2828514 RepID=A0A941IHZ6_9ACTN|nr:FAD-dependent monooxygenase [Actinospica acidithermotolerans]MBR7827774.1 FAD-dependent monooxygenase [Actinospica acidithermotolerans]
MGVQKVLVVGGGITGSVLSLALAQRGVQVDLVEISPVWHGVGHGITVQGNALAAFEKIGILDDVLARGVPYDKLKMCKADGTVIAEVPTPRTGGERLPATMGALRSDLQSILCDRIYAAGVKVRLGLTATSLAQDAQRAYVEFSDGTTGTYDLVVGADGIRSKMRGMLGIDTLPQPTGMSIWRVVAERPADTETHEVYYGGPRYKAGYSPISKDSCYAYVLDEDGTIADFGGGEGGRPAWELMYERSEGYTGKWGKLREAIGPESNVVHTRIEWLLVEDPWFRGRAIVIGDAAHACPPLIAQGAAMCAEDATVLAEMVTGDAPVEKVLPAFMKRRMPRVEIVVRNSMKLVGFEIDAGESTDRDVAVTMSEALGFLASGEA